MYVCMYISFPSNFVVHDQLWEKMGKGEDERLWQLLERHHNTELYGFYFPSLLALALQEHKVYRTSGHAKKNVLFIRVILERKSGRNAGAYPYSSQWRSSPEQHIRGNKTAKASQVNRNWICLYPICFSNPHPLRFIKERRNLIYTNKYTSLA